MLAVSLDEQKQENIQLFGGISITYSTFTLQPIASSRSFPCFGRERSARSRQSQGKPRPATATCRSFWGNTKHISHKPASTGWDFFQSCQIKICFDTPICVHSATHFQVDFLAWKCLPRFPVPFDSLSFKYSNYTVIKDCNEITFTEQKVGG